MSRRMVYLLKLVKIFCCIACKQTHQKTITYNQPSGPTNNKDSHIQFEIAKDSEERPPYFNDKFACLLGLTRYTKLEATHKAKTSRLH